MMSMTARPAGQTPPARKPSSPRAMPPDSSNLPETPNPTEAPETRVDALVRANEELRQSEELMRRILEAVPGGVVQIAADGAIVRANAEAQRVLGLSFDELTRLYVADFSRQTIYEDGRECPVEDYPVSRCLRTGQPQPGLTLGVRRPDGETSWAIFSAVPVLAPRTGRVAGAVVTFLDITARQRAGELLRENESRLRLLTEQMPAILWTTDLELRFTSALGAGLAGLGLTPDQIVGQMFEEFFETEDPQFMPIAAQRRALQGESFSYEMAWRGRTFHVHVEPFRNAAGAITGSTGVALDITARIQAEERLRLREKRFRALMENSSDGIALIEPEGLMLFQSPSVLRLFGYYPAVLVGRNAFEFVHPEEHAELRERLGFLVEHPGEIITTRCRVLHRDGTWCWVEASYTNLLHDPAVRAIVVNYRDISRRKQAEEERDRLFREVELARDRLQSLSHRLVEVQEAERRHLARELHDEIGQQLTALKLDLEQTAAQPPASAGPSLKAALDKANRLLTVVRDLSLDLRPTMLDDLGLLPALHWHFDRHTDPSRLRVTFRHHGIEGRRFPAGIETAAYRITQEALTNVLRHAGVSEVVVRLWASDETLSVQVEDHGVGFNAEAALAAGRSSGLSGMRERVALLGGRFTLESVPGAGTHLTAELPLREVPVNFPEKL